MATAADVDLRGWTRQSSPPIWDGNNPSSSRAVTSLITLSAVSHKSSGSFPLGIMFDATGTTVSDGTDPLESLIYEWDYDDVGSTFTNAPDSDANSSRGAIGCHVYTSAGTYNPTLTITDKNGNTETKSFTITVTDPLNDFDDIYYVSTSGTYPGGTTAGQQLSTYADVKSIFDNIRFNQNGRSKAILFRAGETFTGYDGLLAREGDAPIYVGRYDTGADPIVRPSSTFDGDMFFFYTCDDVTVANIDCQGYYDPSTGLGSHPNFLQLLFDCNNSLVYQCSASNVGLCYYMGGSTGVGSKMAVDNFATAWQDYAQLGSGGNLSASIGNSYKQDVNAVSGSEGKVGLTEPNFPDHGPYRFAGGNDRILVQNNDLFSNAGWSSSGLAHQPCIRMGTDGTATLAIVSDNVMEGGWKIVESSPEGGDDAGICNVLYERNKLTATSNTVGAFAMENNGSIIRNNVIYKPDNGNPPLATGDFSYGVESYGTVPVDVAADSLKVYNNTLISKTTTTDTMSFFHVSGNKENFELYNNIAYMLNSNDAEMITYSLVSDISNLVSDNNLLHAPASSNYSTIFGTGRTLASWQSFSGYDANSDEGNPNFVDDTTTSGAVNVGSPAIDAAKDLGIALDDVNSTTRAVPYNIGASE